MIDSAEAYGLKFLLPANDAAVGRCIRDYGEFARPEAVLISQVLGQGAFVDVGANIGAIALPVARAGNRVVAIEAHRQLAGLLAANALNNGLYNVEVHHAAVGARVGLADFPTMPIDAAVNLGTSGFHLVDQPFEAVRMTTLDAIAPAETTIVKIDVEGFEPQVLAGAANTLATVRPKWIVETSRDDATSRSVIGTFRNAGYRLYWFFAPFVTPTSERVGPPDRLRGDINVFAVPSDHRQPREMTELAVAPTWPSELSDFPYLKRFGLGSGAAPTSD